MDIVKAQPPGQTVLGMLEEQPGAPGVDTMARSQPARAPVKPPPPATSPPAPEAPRSALPSVDGRLVTGQRSPQDSAVVVGLEQYAFIAEVPHAKRDAQAFHDFLLYTRGVPPSRIQLLRSGSNEHLRAAIEQAGRETGPEGRVWVYFAGHGAASPTTRERMLLGDDVRGDAYGFESRGLAVSEVERLASSGGGQVVTVLDTCFTGVGRAGDELLAGVRFAVPDYATATSGPTVAQWNAAAPNQMSGPFQEQEHGAFTYFVIGALRGWADGELTGQRDGTVTAEEANAYVARALRTHGKREQTPMWVGTDAGSWVLSSGVSEVGPDF